MSSTGCFLLETPTASTLAKITDLEVEQGIPYFLAHGLLGILTQHTGWCNVLYRCSIFWRVSDMRTVFSLCTLASMGLNVSTDYTVVFMSCDFKTVVKDFLSKWIVCVSPLKGAAEYFEAWRFHPIYLFCKFCRPFCRSSLKLHLL